jgi:hypothetical protein
MPTGATSARRSAPVSCSVGLCGRCSGRPRQSRPRTAMDVRCPRAWAGAPPSATPNDSLEHRIDRRVCSRTSRPSKARLGGWAATPSQTTSGDFALRSANPHLQSVVCLRPHNATYTAELYDLQSTNATYTSRNCRTRQLGLIYGTCDRGKRLAMTAQPACRTLYDLRKSHNVRRRSQKA